jgi:N-acetylglucosaminyldiphosphoundecaprenol N-acetyl-beta-D-mannosaminyltransferase
MGLRLNITPKDRLLDDIESKIEKKRKFFVTTPNPEIVFAAQADRALMESLRASSLAVADGIGLAAANKFLSWKAPSFLPARLLVCLLQGFVVGLSIVFWKKWLEKDLPIIKGRDLFGDLIKVASEKKWKVYLLGGKCGEAYTAAENLRGRFKGLRIMANAGPLLDRDGCPKSLEDKKNEELVVREINAFSPELLFVGISHPRQEKWLYRWYKKLNIVAGMTVGGTFKYYAGYAKLPPVIFDKIGLSWLWRLFVGDQSLPRVYTAVIKFPFLVLKTKLFSNTR